MGLKENFNLCSGYYLCELNNFADYSEIHRRAVEIEKASRIYGGFFERQPLLKFESLLTSEEPPSPSKIRRSLAQLYNSIRQEQGWKKQALEAEEHFDRQIEEFLNEPAFKALKAKPREALEKDLGKVDKKIQEHELEIEKLLEQKRNLNLQKALADNQKVEFFRGSIRRSIQSSGLYGLRFIKKHKNTLQFHTDTLFNYIKVNGQAKQLCMGKFKISLTLNIVENAHAVIADGGTFLGYSLTVEPYENNVFVWKSGWGNWYFHPYVRGNGICLGAEASKFSKALQTELDVREALLIVVSVLSNYNESSSPYVSLNEFLEGHVRILNPVKRGEVFSKGFTPEDCPYVQNPEKVVHEGAHLLTGEIPELNLNNPRYGRGNGSYFDERHGYPGKYMESRAMITRHRGEPKEAPPPPPPHAYGPGPSESTHQANPIAVSHSRYIEDLRRRRQELQTQVAAAASIWQPPIEGGESDEIDEIDEIE